MIIKAIKVRNFRSIKDETLDCSNLTALVGPNGAGKSSFLRAIDIFYTASAKYSEEDFYGRNTTQPITITMSFTRLSEDEKILFRRYLENEELTVEKELAWPWSRTSQKYYGNGLQNPDFATFYRAQTAKEKKAAYENLDSAKYSSMPRYTNVNDALTNLKNWEQGHPDGCVRARDDGQFFGFKEVGEAHLERYTRFVFVPAVRDARQDAAEGKGSILSDIMDIVVRSVLAKSEDVAKLQQDTQTRYEQIMEPDKLPQLKLLDGQLGNILKRYFPDADVNLNWLKSSGIEIPMPQAEIRLVEDAFTAEVGHSGHGLQRAFIISMLEFLATVTATSDEAAEPTVPASTPQDSQNVVLGADLILGIEEPELYQHPNRQRYLSKALLQLASDTANPARRQTQVIYATHSPLMIDLERFDQLRIFRKDQVESGQPKVTRIAHTTLDEVAKELEKACSKPEGTFSGEALKPHLQALMTPWMNEGFFSQLVVLVEGEEDRAAILGLAAAKAIDFENLEISVIPCMGKSNIDRPSTIFRKLGIPVYAIWDSDFGGSGAKAEDNYNLLRLFGQPTEDWPERVTDVFACFKTTLMKEFESEIGQPEFNQILSLCGERFRITKIDYSKKNPLVIREFFKECLQKNKGFTMLEKIIAQIMALSEASSRHIDDHASSPVTAVAANSS
ncbi:MAG: ATP-dependent endonuclease [Candidatus Bathyarchaeia archaeon]|jgi:predicted ATP-dependent endonuclease of OLD family